MVVDEIAVAASPETTAILVGAGVGASHYVAHRLAGDEDRFADAGVKAAGITVSVAATVATYAVLVLSGVAG